MLRPLVFAAAICAVAALGEAMFMGKDGQRWMRSLRQPRFAPSLLAWAFIGLAYYAICFVALYRLASRRAPAAMALLLLLMAANTFWNYIYFRIRDLKLAFWYSVGYLPLAGALVISLLRSDFVAAIGFIFYIAYLPYALWLFHTTWKLNQISSL